MYLFKRWRKACHTLIITTMLHCIDYSMPLSKVEGLPKQYYVSQISEAPKMLVVRDTYFRSRAMDRARKQTKDQEPQAPEGAYYIDAAEIVNKVPYQDPEVKVKEDVAEPEMLRGGNEDIGDVTTENFMIKHLDEIVEKVKDRIYEDLKTAYVEETTTEESKNKFITNKPERVPQSNPLRKKHTKPSPKGVVVSGTYKRDHYKNDRKITQIKKNSASGEVESTKKRFNINKHKETSNRDKPIKISIKSDKNGIPGATIDQGRSRIKGNSGGQGIDFVLRDYKKGNFEAKRSGIIAQNGANSTKNVHELKKTKGTQSYYSTPRMLLLSDHPNSDGSVRDTKKMEIQTDHNIASKILNSNNRERFTPLFQRTTKRKRRGSIEVPRTRKTLEFPYVSSGSTSTKRTTRIEVFLDRNVYDDDVYSREEKDKIKEILNVPNRGDSVTEQIGWESSLERRQYKTKTTVKFTRPVFSISTPDYYNKQPNAAVKYNFSEPIPFKDQEDPIPKKLIAKIPSSINGKKEMYIEGHLISG